MPEWTPLIISASFDPNPATAGSPAVLSVIVIDALMGEVDEIFYSNEVQSGEV